MMCTENQSRNRQIEADDRCQVTVIIPESYSCVVGGEEGEMRGLWKEEEEVGMVEEKEEEGGQCHRNRHNVLQIWGMVGWASKVGVGWVWRWLGGGGCLRAHRGPCRASYLATMFLQRPSSFLKSATSMRRAEFSFSRKEARMAIWFSFSRRASRDLLAATLFFLRRAQYLSSWKAERTSTIKYVHKIIRSTALPLVLNSSTSPRKTTSKKVGNYVVWLLAVRQS